jgi:hypothetical protein
MHNNIYIEYIAIGLVLLFIGIYGWDYIIVGYSRLSGKTATQIKSAIYFDFFYHIMWYINKFVWIL